jgi:hypothetical protein
MCFKIYHFILLFYQTQLETFIAEFRFNNYKQVLFSYKLYLTNLQIIRQSITGDTKALQRAIRNNPRQRFSSEASSSKLNKKNVLSELLKTFSEKVITNKLENMIYWAHRDRIYLPPDFLPTPQTTLFRHFMDRINGLDPLFQNKLYFYLAKERVDYDQVDQFLNSYIVRYWPALAVMVNRDGVAKKGAKEKSGYDRSSVVDNSEKSAWKVQVLGKDNLTRLK